MGFYPKERTLDKQLHETKLRFTGIATRTQGTCSNYISLNENGQCRTICHILAMSNYASGKFKQTFTS
jgi:hypothetical protein